MPGLLCVTGLEAKLAILLLVPPHVLEVSVKTQTDQELLDATGRHSVLLAAEQTGIVQLVGGKAQIMSNEVPYGCAVPRTQCCRACFSL